MASYREMIKSGSNMEALVGDVGTCFSACTVAGFAYHLVKGLSSCPRNFNVWRSFKLACHRAPQVGGVGGGFAVAMDAVQYVDLVIRDKDDVYNTLFSSALGAAAVGAKHGFRSASLSALVVGTVFTAGYHWIGLKSKYDEKLKNLDANTHTRFAD